MIYKAEVLTDNDQIDSIARQWGEWRDHQVERHIENGPDWVRLAVEDGRHRTYGAMVAVLREEGKIDGVAPFLVRDWTLSCTLGYRTVIRFPMVMAALCGETFSCPSDQEAVECLWRAVSESAVPYNVLFLECLPCSSALWRTIVESPAVRRKFWVYMPDGITPRHRIRLPGTFDEYLQKFEHERRRKLKQEIRRLDKACGGDLVFERITGADQVPDFLKAVEAISSRSWQGTRLGQVLRATDDQVKTLQSHASRGWLRSYLLRTSQDPVAFGIGLQSEGTYYYERTGFDPRWRSHSPGKVMLMRMIEDVCTVDRLKWFDFRHGYSEYKQFFGNDTFPEANVYLFRKSAYTAMAMLAKKCFVFAAATGRRVLDGIGQRKSVRRLLRGQPVAKG